MKEELFSQLIDESLPMLRSVAYRILGNAADADDAVQEALLRAWKKFGSFTGKAKLSSWVYRVTANIAYDMLRKRQREEKKLQAMLPETTSEDDNSSRIEVLTLAIAELPKKFRDALTATFFSGLSGEEAAALQKLRQQ